MSRFWDFTSAQDSSDGAPLFDPTDERPLVRQKTIDDIRAELRSDNPWRWMRMRSDVRWMRRRMKKRGYNPEDFRWIL
ncbi:MAG TPA: hypothetical protein VIY48_18245 [Candidatus Paceibacterota bacterium]